MKRKDFLRNAMMALAVSFVPKVLQPILVEIPNEVISLDTPPPTFKFDIKYFYYDGQV